MRYRRPVPGEVIAVGLLAEALALDVLLLRRNHDLISTCLRRSYLARCVVLALAAHLCGSFRFDPLTAAGELLARRQEVDGPVP